MGYKTACFVREELEKNKQNYHNKQRWEKLRDKLQKEYCWENCLLCPHLKLLQGDK